MRTHDSVPYLDASKPSVIAADAITPENQPSDDAVFFTWSASPSIPVQIEPVDSKALFSPDKTYWLVGLTGGLGLSLCKWMIDHGARNVVISSRNPKVEKSWEEHIKTQGAKVKIYANDITDRDSVRAVHKLITEEFPPIAGVAQGAMVLADTMFVDVDMERVQRVLKPKVDGSIYLEEIFAETRLEFFVFFSPMAYVTGSKGQSIYAAANAFMTSLAAQRRKRGLAGSAINIGTIIGNGYVTRELTVAQQEYLRRVGNVFMSEQDFHQIFAEGVVAGRETASDIPEIMTGLRFAHEDDDEKMTWLHNPKFSHCVLPAEETSVKSVGSKQNISVKAQLLTATTSEEVFEMIQSALAIKLKSTLQTDPSVCVDNMNADDLGIDSLVAVDIRSWFIKELSVEMPVLKILGGFTVRELATEAQQNIPDSLIPNLGKEIDPKFKAAAKISTEQAPRPAEKLFAHGDNNFDEFEDGTEGAMVDTLPTPGPRVIETQDTYAADFVRPKGVAFDEPQSPDSGASIGNRGSTSDSSLAPDDDIDSDRKSTIASGAISEVTSVSQMEEYFPKHDSYLVRSVPMSFGQTRFWFLTRYLEDQTTFNITTSIRLEGNLRVDDFASAVEAVGRRHESLRTTFFDNRIGTPMQGVLREPVLKLDYKHVSNTAEVDVEYDKIKSFKYNLSSGETMKIVLLSLSNTRHQVIIGYHHINMDGISLEVLLSDIQAFYERKPLSRVSIQYPDFSYTQRTEYSKGLWSREIDFWKSEFIDIPPPLPILDVSQAKVRNVLTKYSFKRSQFRVNAATTSQILAIGKRTKTSAFNFYLAAFKTLLLRCSSQEQNDICIGMADGGRNNHDVASRMGSFLNLLPLRFKTQSTQTFNDAIKEARSKTSAALSNSSVPFDLLIKEVNATRSSRYSPLFQAFINYRQGVQDKRTYCGCESEATQFDGSDTAYDISIDILDNPGGETLVVFAGQSSLYAQADVDLLSQSYHNLIKAFAKNPASRLERPALYAPDATKEALELARGPLQTYQWPETLVHRIDEISQAHESKVALRYGQSSITYRQLSDKINAIATTLKAREVIEGSRVGVFQDAGFNFICSMLAILRIGATFIALDPRLTLPRLADIVQDSFLDAIICDKYNRKNLSALGLEFKKIDVQSISAKSNTYVANKAESGAIAMILYTSGSTGKPKGILFNHSSWRNQIESSTQAWQPATGSGTHLQQSPWSFDISVSQTFLALANANTLVVVPKEKRGDSSAISQLIVSEGVTFTQGTPSEYVSWLSYGDTEALRKSEWRFAMTGGEQMTRGLISEFRNLSKHDLRVVNAYGPAEITLCIGSADVNYKDGDSLDAPLRAFPNYSLYLLDSKMRPVPCGVPGEVYIGGAGVSKGYLNNESLTEERFLADEFAPPEYLEKGWIKMHRSGDLGRLSPDGGLVLEGRIDGDTQIKLRGIRIELRDVESVTVQHSNGIVKYCVVSLRASGASGAEFLVGHVVMSAEFTGDRDATLEDLRASLPLPQYMQPAKFIPLESLPTTSTGKVDRKAIAALPLVDSKTKTARAAPNVSSEAKLKDLWQRILGEDILSLHTIDSSSDFFHVGGSSLLLVKLQALIKSSLGVEIDLVQLFENSSLSAMARIIDPASATTHLTFTPPEGNIPKPQSSEPEQTVLSSAASGIDWEEETALSDDLYSLDLDPSSKDIGLPFKTVVVTGATGFLGQALLSHLISDKSIVQIHAIAVRHPTSALPLIFSDPKVEVHSGDLALPRLGLSENTAQEIFSVADAVIHNGADVSFLKSYQTLAKTNVQSTRELVKLCLPCQVPLHFISSASVAHLTGKTAVGEESVAAFEPPRDGSDGYTASKWASERFLERVVEKLTLPVWIHQPSSITGEGAPALDLMTNMLSYSKKMRKVPKSPAWKGSLDFVSADRVASEIVAEIHNDNVHTAGTVEYLFESGDQVIDVGQIKDALELEAGETFEVLGVEEWTRDAVAEGLHELVAAYLKAASEAPIVFPKLLKRKSRSTASETRAVEPTRKLRSTKSAFSLRGAVSMFFKS